MSQPCSALVAPSTPISLVAIPCTWPRSLAGCDGEPSSQGVPVRLEPAFEVGASSVVSPTWDELPPGQHLARAQRGGCRVLITHRVQIGGIPAATCAATTGGRSVGAAPSAHEHWWRRSTGRGRRSQMLVRPVDAPRARRYVRRLWPNSAVKHAIFPEVTGTDI